MDLRCESCNKPIVYSGYGRPPTRFCSRKCKDALRAKDDRARKLAKRNDRTCLNCGVSIPAEVTGRAKFCSRKCGVTWKNGQRAEATRAAWRAKDLRCARCGSPVPIPDAGSHRLKYCSAKCKKLDADERWRASSPHYNRQYNYGITPEQYQEQMETQAGRCAICRSDEWLGKGNRPHTDHCHETKRFRGILCGNENIGVGLFGDDPLRLLAAARYLLTAAANPVGLGKPCDDLTVLASALTRLACDDPALLQVAAGYLEQSRR